MKPEDKIQVEIVLWFSHTFPEYRGCLWGVFNEDSKHKKSLGMHKGASDLMLFVNNTFAGIEVKAPNSTHKTTHISQQLEWGTTIIKNGGVYMICSDIEEIKAFITGIINDTFYVTDGFAWIERAIEKGEKTIKF